MKVYIQLTTDDGKTLSGTAELHPVSAKTQSPEAAPVQAAVKNKCSHLIEKLWKDGAFKQAMDAAGIKKAVEAIGYSFPQNTMQMALSRARYLTRHGNPGSFTWKQKYPSN